MDKIRLNLLPVTLAVILLTVVVVFIFVSDIICVGYRCYLPVVIRNSKPENVYRQDREYFISSYRLNGIQTLLNVKKVIGGDPPKSAPEQKLEQIKVLYQPRFSTYPEVITREITCEDKYKPLFGQVNSGSLTIYYAIGQLTERLTFGACADDLIKYRGIQAFYRCSDPPAEIELTVAEAISGKLSEDFPHNLVSSITCPNFFPGLPITFTGIRQELFRQQIAE